MADAADAQKRWEAENQVQTVKPDQIYSFNEEEYNKFLSSKPWAKDPHHFKSVKISAVALLKMVMHARSGGRIEVMGMMQGRVDGNSFIITDAFAVPVEATEVRVNAQAEAYEYMVEYLSLGESVGRNESAVGWYHSHPGYGCWLSGIDVNTEMQNQQFQDPWLAIVVDPVRTISSGKVEIGAFRTYPKGYKPPDEGPSEYQTIPLEKIEDFGVHLKSYYQLDVSVFKSALDGKLLDLLWNKYWVSTLASSPTLTNRDFTNKQIADLSGKLEQAETQLSHSGRVGALFAQGDKAKEESQLSKVTKDSTKVSVEQINGLMTQVIKHSLFNKQSG
jgi:COP9 signalosome complex subunit 5